MDYMYAACSTTARRGALDWAPVFEKANRPVFEALYKSVRDGTETRKSLEFNNRKTYRQDLERELKEIDSQEIWRAGKPVSLPSCCRHQLIVGPRQDCTFSASRLQAIINVSLGCMVYLYLYRKVGECCRIYSLRTLACPHERCVRRRPAKSGITTLLARVEGLT